MKWEHAVTQQEVWGETVQDLLPLRPPDDSGTWELSAVVDPGPEYRVVIFYWKRRVS